MQDNPVPNAQNAIQKDLGFFFGFFTPAEAGRSS
jgi:hypothetical protein